MLFECGPLKVREIENKDRHLLAKWLSDPSVLKYYEGRDRPFDLEKVNNKFYSADDETIRCIIEFENNAIGYIQYYQLEEKERHDYGYQNTNRIIYGTDQFIGETKYWNRGVGKVLVQNMVHYLINQKQADRVVMDPQTWNERAIRCYEKCGFRKVKVLPKHEFHEGVYRDSWLMEKNRPK